MTQQDIDSAGICLEIEVAKRRYAEELAQAEATPILGLEVRIG